MSEYKGYKGTETFHLMVKNSGARSVVGEWVEHNIQSDMRVRRSKVRGHVVIETKDVMFSAYVQKNWPGCQVHIEE